MAIPFGIDRDFLPSLFIISFSRLALHCVHSENYCVKAWSRRSQSIEIQVKCFEVFLVYLYYLDFVLGKSIYPFIGFEKKIIFFSWNRS